MAAELDYVPMPEAVVKQVQGAWKQVTDGSGKALY
jgi:phosphate transport system substrate-binding protein